MKRSFETSVKLNCESLLNSQSSRTFDSMDRRECIQSRIHQTRDDGRVTIIPDELHVLSFPKTFNVFSDPLCEALRTGYHPCGFLDEDVDAASTPKAASSPLKTTPMKPSTSPCLRATPDLLRSVQYRSDIRDESEIRRRPWMRKMPPLPTTLRLPRWRCSTTTHR